jgi:putative flavoprotein involved in K+ transport
MSAVTPTTATEQREVVVIGGGQAGLAIGYFLAKQGRRFTILEAAGEPAAAWRARWDSLKLFTPVRYDSLPGLAFPGEPHRLRPALRAPRRVRQPRAIGART